MLSGQFIPSGAISKKHAWVQGWVLISSIQNNFLKKSRKWWEPWASWRGPRCDFIVPFETTSSSAKTSLLGCSPFPYIWEGDSWQSPKGKQAWLHTFSFCVLCIFGGSFQSLLSCYRIAPQLMQARGLGGRARFCLHRRDPCRQHCQCPLEGLHGFTERLKVWCALGSLEGLKQ